MYDADGIDEIDALLNAEGPDLKAMDEQTEQEIISLLRRGTAQLGADAVVDVVYKLVSEHEDSLRATETPAARYCLEWLEAERARRDHGFE